MSTDITITKVNETFMKVKCVEKYMELDIQDRFSFKIQNPEHDPRVKRGVWDGIKKLYNRRDKTLYVGLLYSLLSFLDKQGYTYTIDKALLPSEETIEASEVKEIIDQLIKPVDGNGNLIEIRDYQLEAVTTMLNMGRSTCLAATSAGKSLIVYILIRIYSLMEEFEGKNIFLTVPSKGLVEQMYSDFAEYSAQDPNWFVSANCQRISGKYDKYIDKQVVITTWQSLQRMPHHTLDLARAIIIDETHTAKANVLSNLVESATNCPIRHGLTGTLDEVECNQLVIQGLLGPSFRAVTAKQLIDEGYATPIEVDMVILRHNQKTRKELNDKQNEDKHTKAAQKYANEIDFINQLKNRRDFIHGCTDMYKGNSIVLFDRVESYGKELYEEMAAKHERTYYISGDVDVTVREDIRSVMEKHEDAKLYASFGTCQQGMNIKRLDIMVLSSSSKSIIRVLQSLGRMMRLHSSKKVAHIIDVVDDLTYEGKPNYTLLHSHERVRFYTDEGHKVNFIEVDL